MPKMVNAMSTKTNLVFSFNVHCRFYEMVSKYKFEIHVINTSEKNLSTQHLRPWFAKKKMSEHDFS